MDAAAPLSKERRDSVHIDLGNLLGEGSFGQAFGGHLGLHKMAFKLSLPMTAEDWLNGPASRWPMEMANHINHYLVQMANHINHINHYLVQMANHINHINHYLAQMANHLLLGEDALKCHGWFVKAWLSDDGKTVFRTVMVVDLMAESLHDFIWHRKEPLGVKSLVKILTDVVVGVQRIHAKGLLHNDLKAENILVKFLDWPGAFGFPPPASAIDGKLCHVRIADLGLTTHWRDLVEMRGGTLYYMGFGDGEAPSKERDVYAIGYMVSFLLLEAPCLRHLRQFKSQIIDKLVDILGKATHTFGSVRPTTNEVGV
eukprot:gene31411-6577_t